MDLLTYLFVGIPAALALTAMYPPGLALLVHAFVAVRDSKVLQWIAGFVVFLVAVWVMRRDARKQGEKEALKDVQAATERAVESKRSIDRDVAKEPIQRKRDELGRWSR